MISAAAAADSLLAIVFIHFTPLYWFMSLLYIQTEFVSIILRRKYSKINVNHQLFADSVIWL